MKKVRIITKEDRTKDYHLFDSPEALYLWLNEVEDDAINNPEGCDIVTLNPDEFIEAEWLGCEFVNEGNSYHSRLDFIRLAKRSKKIDPNGNIVSIHCGWIDSSEMSFNDEECFDSYTLKLTDPTQWELDLDLLFDEGEEDSEKNSITEETVLFKRK